MCVCIVYCMYVYVMYECIVSMYATGKYTLIYLLHGAENF